MSMHHRDARQGVQNAGALSTTQLGIGKQTFELADGIFKTRPDQVVLGFVQERQFFGARAR